MRVIRDFMKLQQYFDVSSSADLGTFEQRLIAFAHDFDFGLINAVVVAERPGLDALVYSVGNTPSAFAEAAVRPEDVRRDPVSRRLKTMSVPFAYDQALYVREGAGDLWENQAVYGYKAGIAVALHLRDNKHFLLGVDREGSVSLEDDAMTHLFASLQLLAVHAQDAALRLLTIPVDITDSPQLTSREREVLQWTKDGKSAWAVGEILSISENTVNFHLRNVLRKLESSSKHQAVLRAIALGLIQN